MHGNAVRMLGVVGALTFTLVLATACSSAATPMPLPSPPASTTPEASPMDSVLPTPIFESVLPTPTMAVAAPTADAESATVIGALVGASSGEAVASALVFLERTRQERTVPRVLYGPPDDQPSATTDEAGRFVISDVPEGEFVIVVYSPPLELSVVTSASTEEPLFVTARVNDVIDLGTASVPDM